MARKASGKGEREKRVGPREKKERKNKVIKRGSERDGSWSQKGCQTPGTYRDKSGERKEQKGNVENLDTEGREKNNKAT